MLDTNTVSHIVKGWSAVARAKLTSLPPHESACISAVTEAELLYGLAKRPLARELNTNITAFLARTQILDWGSEAAAAYGQLRAKQESLGKTIGSLDLLIAAHAISAGAVLVTNDRAFSQVQGLLTTRWATDL